MALVETLVHETSTTSGTGDLDLDGPVAGARSFLAAFGASAKCLYFTRDADDYEYGRGTVISGTPNKLQRDAIPIGSSNGGALVNWPVGGKRDVYSELPAERMLIGRHNTTATTDPVVGDDSDDGYARGSNWFNTSSGAAFRCMDPAVAAAVWQLMGPGLELIEVLSASASATLDLETGFGPVYGVHLFVIDEILAATAGQPFRGRVKVGGSWRNGGVDYAVSQTEWIHDAAASHPVGGTDAHMKFTRSAAGNASSQTINGLIYLFTPDATVAATRFLSSVQYLTNGSKYATVLSNAWFIGNNLAVDGVRFFFGSGNITSGKILHYGMRE